MLTDSRYWIQALDEMDHNWTLIKVGSQGQSQDWIEWLMVRGFDFQPIFSFKHFAYACRVG